MCDICNKYFCPPGCPSFMGITIGRGHAVGACDVCGRTIYQADVLIRKSKIKMCADCGIGEYKSEDQETKNQRRAI